MEYVLSSSMRHEKIYRPANGMYSSASIAAHALVTALQLHDRELVISHGIGG